MDKNQAHHGRWILRWGILAGILGGTILLNRLAGLFPLFIEKYYSRGLSALWMRLLSALTGWLPFSLAEGLLGLLVIAPLFLLVWLIVRILRKTFRPSWAGFHRAAYGVSFGLVSVYVLFILSWGLNYSRVPLPETLGLSPGDMSVHELAALARSTAHAANELREDMRENEDGIAVLQGSVTDALRRTGLGYEILPGMIPGMQVAHAHPKGVLTSRVMSYLGIEGFFFPFTAEANINIDTPAFLIPFSASHELAHLGGYAREEEANFIACLACRAHPDNDFRYAGRLSELIYILNALYEADNGMYSGLREDLHPGIHRDLAFLNHYWDKYDGVMEEVAEVVNDIYLKSNLQEEGILSYGMVVDLLLADYQTPVL